MQQIQSVVSSHLLLRTAHTLKKNCLQFAELQFAFKYYGLSLDEEQLLWYINSIFHSVTDSSFLFYHSKLSRVLLVIQINLL